MFFCIHTDRYRDSKHKKFETDTPIRNAFSITLNLAHNPKIRVYSMIGNFEVSLMGKATRTASLCMAYSPDYCLCFACLPFWLICVALKDIWPFRQHHTMRPSTYKSPEQWSLNLNIIQLLRAHNVRPTKVSFVVSPALKIYLY